MFLLYKKANILLAIKGVHSKQYPLTEDSHLVSLVSFVDLVRTVIVQTVLQNCSGIVVGDVKGLKLGLMVIVRGEKPLLGCILLYFKRR